MMGNYVDRLGKYVTVSAGNLPDLEAGSTVYDGTALLLGLGCYNTDRVTGSSVGYGIGSFDVRRLL